MPVSHPQPGWVEQDPELILEAIVQAVAEVLEAARRPRDPRGGPGPSGRVGDGLGDRAAIEPLSPVIVWQDKRQEALLVGGLTDRRRALGAAARPLLLGRQARLAAAGRIRTSGRAGAGPAAPRDGRCLHRRPAGGPLRDRPLDRLADAAAGAGRARLGRAAAGGVRDRSRPAPEHRARASASWASSATSAGPSRSRCGRSWSISRPRWPARVPSRRAGEGDLRHGRLRARANERGPDLCEGLLPTVAWAGPRGRRRPWRDRLRARRRRVRGRGPARVALRRAGAGRGPRLARRDGPHGARQRRRQAAAGARGPGLALVEARGAGGDRGTPRRRSPASIWPGPLWRRSRTGSVTSSRRWLPR